MLAYPNCKINLGLHIVGRRPDGYHNLETLFLPVHTLRDELEITPLPDPIGQRPTLVQEGLTLDNAPDDNLCLRAWQLLHDEYGIPPVHIRLKKGIPFGAGLGGGSSDAAFTLKMLNTLFALGLEPPQLERLAARLGADCPFFVRNQPAYATGIGDLLEPLPHLSALNSQFRIHIELPEGEHISTREAYAGLDTRLFGTPRPDLRQAVRQPVGQWRDLIVNDFEASLFPSHPAIASLKADLYRRGALYASMSGSGSALFALFPA